jgi:Sec-independent protein translocase protein TatA
MSLYEIDHEATQRRLDEIISDGLRALREVREESEEIDKAVQEMLEKRELERQALDEQVEAAAQPVEPEPEEKPRPKPTTLALGGDEFRQEREARKTQEPVEAPEQKDEPQARRTFKLGAPEDDDTPAPAQRPVRKRPPRPEGEDDQSGRTWLR